MNQTVIPRVKKSITTLGEQNSHKKFDIADFHQIKQLGTGSFGQVSLVVLARTGQTFALKQI